LATTGKSESETPVRYHFALAFVSALAPGVGVTQVLHNTVPQESIRLPGFESGERVLPTISSFAEASQARSTPTQVPHPASSRLVLKNTDPLRQDLWYNGLAPACKGGGNFHQRSTLQMLEN
jgi:hypothetical protein